MKGSEKERKKRKNKERTKNKKNGASVLLFFPFLLSSAGSSSDQLYLSCCVKRGGKGGRKEGRAGPCGSRRGAGGRARRNRPRGTGSSKGRGLGGQQQQQREQGRGLHTPHVRPSSGPAQSCVLSPCETGRSVSFFSAEWVLDEGFHHRHRPAFIRPSVLEGPGKAQHSTAQHRQVSGAHQGAGAALYPRIHLLMRVLD